MSFRVIRTETVGKVSGHVIKVETTGEMLSDGDTVRYGNSISVVNKKLWYKDPYLCVFFNVVKGKLPTTGDVITIVNPYEDSQIDVEIIGILNSKNFTAVRTIGKTPEIGKNYVSSSGSNIIFIDYITESPVGNNKSLWIVKPDGDLNVGMVFKDKEEIEEAEKAVNEKMAAEKVAAEKVAAEKAEAEKVAEAERIIAKKAAEDRIAEAERIIAEKAAAEEKTEIDTTSETVMMEDEDDGLEVDKNVVKKKATKSKPKKKKDVV